MTDQEILDNAPKGATHYSQGIHYLALNSSNSWMRYDPNGFANAKWFAANDYKLSYSNKNFRSLADIKRIAELEKERAVRDLEQQAKGLIDFSITYNEMATNPDSLVNLLVYCANVLLGKAKALQEQGE